MFHLALCKPLGGKIAVKLLDREAIEIADSLVSSLRMPGHPPLSIWLVNRLWELLSVVAAVAF